MANVFNRGKFEALNLDVDAQSLKAILLTTGFAYDKDHNFVSQISANRGAGTTDQALASLTLTEDDTGDQAFLDAADSTWTAVAGGQTITGCVIYRVVGSEATDPLWGFINTTDTAANGGNITIQYAANGVLALTD